MAVRHSITLSITEPNNEVGVIKIRQADEQTQMLDVQITENGVPKSYKDFDVYFCAKLGQTAGLGIIEQKLNLNEMTDPANGKLVYTMRAEDWQILGRQRGYFSFRKMVDEHKFTQQFTTREFTFQVIKSVFSEGLQEVKKDGSTYVWTIEEMIRLLDEYIATGKTDWLEFIRQNQEIIESVDPGGTVLLEIIKSRTPVGAVTPFPSLAERLNAEFGQLSSFRPSESSIILKITQEALERGVTAKSLGAKGDGVTDDWEVIKNGLDTHKYVLLSDGNYALSKHLNPRQGQAIVGITETIRDYEKTAKLTYIGDLAPESAFVLLGKNQVGAEPIYDGTNNALINVHIDCNNKIGFGVYGTYLTNETVVSNVVVKNSLEYNFYFAKAWYAKFVNLVSMDCRNSGMSFGMPIYYLDGRVINWTTSNPLEMNNCLISNIRSIRSGKHFSIDNPGTFKVIPSMMYLGFGIGFGEGHGFNVRNWISESSGGIAVIDYCAYSKVKVIEKGYVERSCLNSGLDSLTLCSVLIVATKSAGGRSILRDVYINPQSGGIFHTGDPTWKHYLENVYEPSFLRSLDGVSLYDLYSIVIKRNVHYACGSYNTDPSSQTIDSVTKVNTRYSFKIEMNVEKRNRALWVKAVEGGFYGGIDANDSSGGKTNFILPQDLSKTEWTRLGVLNRNVVSLTKSGVDGPENREIMIKVVNLESTDY